MLVGRTLADRQAGGQRDPGATLYSTAALKRSAHWLRLWRLVGHVGHAGDTAMARPDSARIGLGAAMAKQGST